MLQLLLPNGQSSKYDTLVSSWVNMVVVRYQNSTFFNCKVSLSMIMYYYVKQIIMYYDVYRHNTLWELLSHPPGANVFSFECGPDHNWLWLYTHCQVFTSSGVKCVCKLY